ncbi:MAG: DUF4258 domain-containing protein [Phycisphaerae bacterium]|nr:DUF4258 domain-containing protein [Phycisphaerae bacterium]
MKRKEKPIRYEKHALKRMGERSVSTDQVERAVRSPDGERVARREGATRLEKRFSARRRLVVIIEEEHSFVRVVTTFWS